MPFFYRLKRWGQLGILLVLGVLTWYLLHKPAKLSADIYPYLYSLQTDMILLAQDEGQGKYPNAWADILAIRSSVPEEAERLLGELKNGRDFSHINWGNIPIQRVKEVTNRRSILLRYPYYEPKRYYFPIEGKYWYEDSFGAGREGGKRKHEGTDLFGKEGTTIVSVCPGEVEELGWNRLGGERVGIRGGDGNYYYYAHLEKISAALWKGKRVSKGEKIGTMGHTGDALTTPDHLHFGIELPNGIWINPYPFLRVWERVAL
ncbi:MAG: M23 family metallopeptidase [Desulfitobacteriaceae bacterium]